jgi:hypothetical protein
MSCARPLSSMQNCSCQLYFPQLPSQKRMNEWMNVWMDRQLHLTGHSEQWHPTHIHSAVTVSEVGIKALHHIHICFQGFIKSSCVKKCKGYDRKCRVQDVWSNLYYASYLLYISCCIWNIHNNADLFLCILQHCQYLSVCSVMLG